MKQPGSILCFLTLVLAATAACLEGGEIIDRIAASVGRQVITDSQVTEEIRVTALLDGKPPDWSNENRAKTVNRLVDQMLIRREIEQTRFPLAPADEGAKLLAQFKAAVADFPALLASNHLTEALVAKHLLWQANFLRFVEYRFKPSINLSEADLKDFYSTQAKEWQATGRTVPSFEDARPDLEKLLTSKYVDQALDRWLGDQRIQVPIVFKPTPGAGRKP